MVTKEHNEGFEGNTINHQIFIVAAHKAITSLGWKIFYAGKQGFIAFTDTNAEVKIAYNNGDILITADFDGGQAEAEQFKDVFLRAAATTGAEAAQAEYELISKSFEHEETDALGGEKNMAQTIAGFFIPIKKYFVTPLLIDINILIYIIMICCGIHFFEPDAESMLAWGANYKPITLSGEWWRMFTSCFLHFGILHLLLNMYALGYIGLLLEPLMGKSRYLAAYLLSGIAASAASLWYNNFVVSGGASGAIFGMYGVFLALLLGNIVHKSLQKELFANIGFFVVLNLAFGFSQTGIDNAAHIGGLVSGFVIGLVMLPGLKNRKSSQHYWGSVAASAVLCIGVAWAAYTYSSNDAGKYDALIQQFSANESIVSNAFKENENATDAQAAIIIKGKILPAWKKNAQIAGEIEALDLPDYLEERSKLIKDYSALQIENYNLLYKKATENSAVYDKRIEQVQAKILAILKKVNPADNKESK